jgi:hypothetical protein
MGCERAIVEAQSAASKRRVQAGTELADAGFPFGDPEPCDARPAALRKSARSIEGQRERGHERGGLRRGGDDIGEPLVRRVAEEREGQMEVLDLYAPERRQRRGEDVVSARREVRRQLYREEEAHASERY